MRGFIFCFCFCSQCSKKAATSYDEAMDLLSDGSLVLLRNDQVQTLAWMHTERSTTLIIPCLHVCALNDHTGT